jgi:hypothetical protein
MLSEDADIACPTSLVLDIFGLRELYYSGGL